jgi:hypothetical protein
MAFSPFTAGLFTAGQILTAAQMNTYIRDNINFLYKPPMCVLNSTTPVGITASVNTDILYSTESVDTDTMHSTTVNTGRITINTAGVYVVNAQLAMAGSGADGSRVLARIVKNGTEICRTDTGNYGATTEVAFCLAITTSCAVTDYLTFTVLQVSAGARNLNSSAFAASFVGNPA